MVKIQSIKIQPYLGIGQGLLLKRLVGAIVVLFIACFPLFIRDTFFIHLGSVIFLTMASALGFNFIFRSGQLTFGHAGWLAIGAYTSSLLVLRLGAPFFLGLILAILVAFLLGIFLGSIFSRIAGLFFILLTFAAGEVIRLFLINVPSLTYGTDGVIGIPPPSVPILGLTIASREGLYWVNLAVVILVAIFLSTIYKSNWGRALAAVKSNLLLAECTGIDTKRYRLLAFGIGCGIAGLAGSFSAHFYGYIAPSSFTFWRTIDALFANVVGGLQSLVGVFIGAVIVACLPELLRGFVAWQVALYGLILVLVMRFVPGGIGSILEKFWNRESGANSKPNGRSPVSSELASNGIIDERLNWMKREGKVEDGEILRVDRLTKDFGGLRAVDELSFELKRGEILGIIGPNGAGKTTLFNLITGVIGATSGKLFLKDKDITSVATHKIARLGLTRTFQATNLYSDVTTWENVVRGMSYRLKGSFWRTLIGMWRRGEENEAEYIEADQIISSLGLSFCRNELVVSLPYGIQRKVQLALAMATRPEILLLDEPVSGMNRTEATSMADLIRKTREAGITVVIVEHNMDFVMNLCERIIVVDYGAKIAEGLPHEIANNPEVIKAYLGDIDAT